MKKNIKALCLSALTIILFVSSASAEKTWTTYNTEDGLVDNKIRSLAIDTDNVKWFGTWIDGVSSFDGTTWTTYTTEDGLVDNEITAIAVDSNNVKWFGTYGGGVSSFDERSVSVENSQDMPVVMDILGNYPNPFNPSTTISFTLPASGFTQLVIYNITGQKVRELISETMTAGMYNVLWDGRDTNGSVVSSGIYFCKLVMDDCIAIHRMVFVK